MDTWKKSEMLEAYAENLRVQAELDVSLQDKTEKREWLDAFRKRADRMDQLYQQNEGIAASLKESAGEQLTAEAAEFLYEKLLKGNKKGRYDGRIALPILVLLIPYYEAHHDPEKLVRLYGFIYSIQSSGGKDASRTEYSRKIIALRNEYDKLRDVRARLEVFQAYYMICVGERSDGLVTVDESYRYLQDMLELWESEAVQRLDGENEHIRWYVSLTESEWLAAEEDIDTAGEAAQAYFCELAQRCYEEELESAEHPHQCANSIVAAWYHARVLTGELTANEAIRGYFGYYSARLAHPEDELGAGDDVASGEVSVDEANFLLDAPMILIRWLGKCSDPQLRDQVLEQLRSDTHAILYRKFAGLPDTAITKGLAKWCFAMLPHLGSRGEKEEWVFNLVVCKQFITYLHSVMVDRLAQAISASLLEDDPHCFDSVKALLGDQSLGDFISKAALFHDIGKCQIADIVNTQVRALEDDEFAEIRRHPAYGCAHIAGDRDLARYHDVILGHHKFYDGKGGYPADFDNTASPYRLVIDLMTICDSLDAATDTLGRNYKGTKTFDQVLGELVRDAGTRYDPDIVAHIRSNVALRRTLRELVEDQRGDIAYEIYTSATER